MWGSALIDSGLLILEESWSDGADDGLFGPGGGAGEMVDWGGEERCSLRTMVGYGIDTAVFMRATTVTKTTRAGEKVMADVERVKHCCRKRCRSVQ